MPTAPSLDSHVCADVPRWYSTNLGALEQDTPISLGHSCITDLCVQLLLAEEYTQLVPGIDYTADLEAGTVTLLSDVEGVAIAYFNVVACAPEVECKTSECCPPDVQAYRSASATDSDVGTNGDCRQVIAEVTPISGAFLFFPSFVILTTDNDEAVIRYTTDGSDPDLFSTIYTEPFQITQSGTTIKARAWVGDCSPGPVLTVLYQGPPFPIGMAFGCAELDKGGTWGVWVPNGTLDNHWQIQFILSGATTIKRLEMYQLNAAGVWDTGIVWSTASPINAGFAAMPLLVFIGGVQQWAAYQTSLGLFGAATHTWDLYGDKQFPSGGFFRLDMILDDNTRITSVINGKVCNPTLPPLPCPSPAAPTVTAECDGTVVVTFANTIGQAFKLYVSEIGAPGGWTLFEETVTVDNPQDRTVSGLVPGALYYFRVELEYAGCGFTSSIAVAGVPLPDPEVTIATDKTIVDPNESFTISWTSTHIGGAVCGGCLDGQVSINQSLGCKAGNGAGSQATSKATAGLYTYEITGCNSCGTVTASVQVEVRNVAVCSVQPALLTVNVVPTTFLCPLGACAVGYSVQVPWNGQIPKTSACLWSLAISGGCEAAAFPGSGAYASMIVSVGFSAGVFFLQFVATTGAATLIWRGEKLFGNSPLGLYTRTGGCAAGPASITIT